MIRQLLLSISISLVFWNNAQVYETAPFGVKLGVYYTFGTHVHGAGIDLSAYYQQYFYQLNIGQRTTFYFNHLGDRRTFWESRSAAGLVLLAGKRQSRIDFEWDALNHQTAYNYGVAFNYLIYWDQANTTQLSGGWGLHLRNLSIRFENDVFGGQARDRFRTGHLAFSYRLHNFKFNTGLYIWTGETRGSTWVHFPAPKMPGGYRSLEDLPYGRTSHGIVYGGVLVRLPYGNSVNWRLGVDSEQIRHAFQNRLTHDLILLPKRMERNTPHYPRLDVNGCPTFDKDSIRPNRFFMQMGLNDTWGN